MKNITLFIVALALVSCISVKVDSEKDSTNKTSNVIKKEAMNTLDISMYPEAKKGFKRYVIELDELPNEADNKLEIFVGKTMEVDCNTHRLMGSFKEGLVNGWGYRYYEFETNGEIISSLMACLDETKTSAFVNGEKQLINYNSKLPVVVYVPDGYELRYSIWKKSDKTYSSK